MAIIISPKKQRLPLAAGVASSIKNYLLLSSKKPMFWKGANYFVTVNFMQAG